MAAVQMYSSKVLQPMLRLVGLWQQFQQANLSVQRLGDLMNAPVEPYSMVPTRLREGKVSMLFITHAMPKNFLVDEIVRIGQGSLRSQKRNKVVRQGGNLSEGCIDSLNEDRIAVNETKWRLAA